MRKLLFFFSLILSVQLISAQDFTNKDKVIINTNVDSVLNAFINTSTFTDPGMTSISQTAVSQFKSLFTPDAKVFDEINATYHVNSTDYPYWNENKRIGDYAHELINNFPRGVTITYKNINISYDSINQKVIRVAMHRQMEAVNSKRFAFQSNDSILIHMLVMENKSVKINGITKLSKGSNLRCLNDEDLDGVINEADLYPHEKGVIELSGAPDFDGDGINDHEDACWKQPGTEENGGCPNGFFAYSKVFSGFAGYMFSKNNLHMPEYSKLAYQIDGESALDEVNTDLSSDGELKNPSFESGFFFGANLAYYFGKQNKKNIGISGGFTFSTFNADYEIIDPARYIIKAFDGDDYYRRLITIKKGSVEKIEYRILNFPVLFRYKAMFGSKWAGEISAGPSFIQFVNKSTFKGTVSFEGLYQMDTTGTTGKFTYEEVYDQSATNTWEVTEDELTIKHGHSLPEANEIISQMNKEKNYDFALNKEKNDETSSKRNGIAYNFNVDAYYQFKPKMAIRFGFGLVIAPFKDKTENYIPIGDNGATTGDYSSFYSVKPKTTYQSYSATIGIILGL